MRILIDGDGCPVIDLTITLAQEYRLEVIIFCDTAHVIERSGVTTRLIGQGSDAVDFALVNELQSGDLVITQDYGLAAMVLAKQGLAMSQNGMLFSSNNIDSLLNSRHIGREIRAQGGRTKGPKKRNARQNEAFKQQLMMLLNKCIANKEDEVEE